jgi:hypothetical protein
MKDFYQKIWRIPFFFNSDVEVNTTSLEKLRQMEKNLISTPIMTIGNKCPNQADCKKSF